MDRSTVLEMDARDPLRAFRHAFVITDPEVCYLDGNSLGRLPHATVDAVRDFLLNEWGRELVTGWEHWIDEARRTGDLIGATALGAAPGQVLACDTTSVNLYQLASAAIAAQPGRRTLVTDAANFPTDRYILQGLARAHGMKLVLIDNEDPALADCERMDPAVLERHMNEDVALLCLQVVQYRSGARQDVRAVNALAARHGALVLWDAAHAAGSIPLDMDASGVQLAVGCTYKYGNAGPGAPAWLYVSHAMQQRLQVPIQGWFAQRDQFAMGAHFERDTSIRGFQIATPPVLGLRCVRTGFGMIGEAGIASIGHKAAQGTDLMITLFDGWLAPLGFRLRTPREAARRGAHITLAHPEAKRIAVALRRFAGVVPDYRAPDSIRLACSPLYTSFTEIHEGFARIRDLVSARRHEEIDDAGERVT